MENYATSSGEEVHPIVVAQWSTTRLLGQYFRGSNLSHSGPGGWQGSLKDAKKAQDRKRYTDPKVVDIPRYNTK